MALITSPATVINSTTNQTATGTADMGAIANRFAVQLVHSGQIGKPTFNVLSSCDDVNFSKAYPMEPQFQFGDWLTFDVPARYVQVNMGGNNGTAEVLIMPQTD